MRPILIRKLRQQPACTATISLVKNENWELLSEKVWYHLARQVGFFCGEWQPADTQVYMLLRILLGDAQHFGRAYGIAISAGMGKTFAAGQYVRENSEALYVAAREEMSRKLFLGMLLRNMGVTPVDTATGMIEQFSNLITEREQPLLIVDDAHKLNSRVLHLLVRLINGLAGKAGIVIIGHIALRDRILEGLRMKMAGYEELYEAIVQKIITLPGLSRYDIELVCRANGITTENQIERITRECGNNLHRATTLINEMNALQMAA